LDGQCPSKAFPDYGLHAVKNKHSIVFDRENGFKKPFYATCEIY